jgi:hypothetical protein
MNAPTMDFRTSFDDVTLLLSIIADPAAHRQRLAELVTQEKATKERIAELHAMEAETVRLNGTAKAVNIVCDRRLAAIEQREADADARAEQLEKAESTRTDANLRRRENAVEAREASVRAESDRLAGMRKDYDARLAKIRTFSSTL